MPTVTLPAPGAVGCCFTVEVGWDGAFCCLQTTSTPEDSCQASGESEAGGAWGWNSEGCPADAQEAAEWVGAKKESDEPDEKTNAKDRTKDSLHDPAASPWIRDKNTDEIPEAEAPRSNAPLPGELPSTVTVGPAYGAPPDYGPAATTGAPAWTVTTTQMLSGARRFGIR